MSNKPQPAALLTALLCERWFNDPRRPRAYPVPWVDGTWAATYWANVASQIVRCRGKINNPGRLANRLALLNHEISKCGVGLTPNLVLVSVDDNRPLMGSWP